MLKCGSFIIPSFLNGYLRIVIAFKKYVKYLQWCIYILLCLCDYVYYMINNIK